ncbi:bifunctional phosphopantothenoylcysteine decarboxylase/phosphopantothenate--cysteine ligase CoaBC [Acidianus infernus]|uniref:bifunctional phosphopantothenoylcysteine decarboxylase/phosphopantothenate--cysteine ligase CoaBC n=1 Tax=Acidianus infernus TaxID=12915 RepID=UPI0035931A0B
MNLFMTHPSKRIIGEISDELKGKKVLLGVSASISLYKSLDLARELMRRGAEIKVMMTPSASKLISPEMFTWATGNKTIVKIGGKLEHIQLAEEFDVMIIAPSTMNIITKLAYGITDNNLVLTAINFLQLNKKVILVPAMHLQMWNSPQLQSAIEILRKNNNVEIIEPNLVNNLAHYPDIGYLTSRITSYILREKDLRGLKIVVTAGPTREYMDPVRFITNPSSGTMGVSIANEAYFRGAEVVLVHGPLSSHLHPYSPTIEVETTEEMLKNVVNLVEKEKFNIVILAGAPADYKFKVIRGEKIDSHTEVPKVELEKTPKISEYIRGKAFVVGFSAETVNNDDELIEKAKIKKERHGFNIIVANNVKRKDIGFSSEYNEVIVITNSEIIKIPKSYKTIIARKLLDIVREEFIKSKV